MQNNGTRKHMRCRAMAPAVRSESSLNSMGEMLICLQMRDSIQSPIILAASALHVLCVGQPLEMIMKKHVQTWLHKAETGKSMAFWFVLLLGSSRLISGQIIFFKKLNSIHYFLPCSFYLMVYAYQSYADGNLQFFGNVQSVEIDGECTGRECLTGGGVTPPPPPPPPGGHSKIFKVIHIWANLILQSFSLF